VDASGKVVWTQKVTNQQQVIEQLIERAHATAEDVPLGGRSDQPSSLVDLRRGLMCDGFAAAGTCPVDGRLHHTEDQPWQPGAEQSGTTRVVEILGIRRRRLLVAESLPNLAEDRAR
jgi:hypothetical protein